MKVKKKHSEKEAEKVNTEVVEENETVSEESLDEKELNKVKEEREASKEEEYKKKIDDLKNESKKVDLEKTVIINSQEPETTVMEKLDESKVADNKKKKLRGTKIPVCISFVPMYFYMVYAAILFKL